jgi:hypothetical protein
LLFGCNYCRKIVHLCVLSWLRLSTTLPSILPDFPPTPSGWKRTKTGI